MQVLDLDGLDGLVNALVERGYSVVGPVMRDAAIVYDEIESAGDLPIGWTDRQEAGSYRVARRGDKARFGYAVGPHSWKRYFFPPEVRLWRLRRTGESFEAESASETSGGGDPAARPYALIGVRSCELHAIHIQDRVFKAGDYSPVPSDHAICDPIYAARRAGAFIVSVQCTEPGGTCFCTSMNAGPRAESGFDLALTEIIDESGHYFVVEIGSDHGREVLQELPHGPARGDQAQAAYQATKRASEQMGRALDTRDIKDLLYRNQEHPRWDEVAQRCLACANCTMVCPTCFCSNVEDTSDLTGEHAERWRRWDSCFHDELSYLHGGSVRRSTRAKYRQWMTHKLASWIDQFDSSGCVGCGRCITWCPVGIDITEELAAIRADERSPGARGDREERSRDEDA